MTPAALLALLRSRSIALRGTAGRLFAMPASAILPDEAALLRTHKAALLALLDAEAREAALAARWEATNPFAEDGPTHRLVESCLVRTPEGYVAVAPDQLLATLNDLDTPAGSGTGASAGRRRASAGAGKSAGTPSSASRAAKPTARGLF